MKVYANDLLKALKQVKRAKLHDFPVLNHVRMEVSGNKVTLITTDLEKPLHSNCESFGDNQFVVCVPMVHNIKVQHDSNGYYSFHPHTFKVYPFYDLIKVHAETNDLLEIEYIPTTCEITIKFERSISTIKCMDAQEFPSIL